MTYESESAKILKRGLAGSPVMWSAETGWTDPRREVAADKLNDVMEIDHVIRVHEDGRVSDVSGEYAPELIDEEIMGEGWKFFTAGYSGQDRYSGPIMHNSEYIGGQLARDILTTPGIYVAVAAYYSADEDESDEDESESEETGTWDGWAVVRKDA